MKRQREDIATDPEAQNLLIPRLSDTVIQREWRHTIEGTLSRFLQSSSLKHISANIAPDYYGNISPFLVKHVLNMSNGIYGVHIALHVILETLRDVMNEAIHRILAENTTPLLASQTSLQENNLYGMANSKDKMQQQQQQQQQMKQKEVTKQSITLLCETLPMPTVTLAQLDENEKLRNATPLQVIHLLQNDVQRGWFAQYRQVKATNIHVFTVKLGPGQSKATPETGRYVVSVLMPLTPPPYRLVPGHEPHSKTFDQLDSLYREVLIELDSHRRMAQHTNRTGANGGALSKHTIQEEARYLASQMQNKQLEELRNLSDNLTVQLGVKTRELNDLVSILSSSKEESDMVSKMTTINLLTQKLQQSRTRNLQLTNRLKQKGIDPESVVSPSSQYNVREGLKQFKKHKLEQVKKKAAPLSSSTTTSSSSSSEYHEESPSFSSNNSTSEEEEEDEDS